MIDIDSNSDIIFLLITHEKIFEIDWNHLYVFYIAKVKNIPLRTLPVCLVFLGNNNGRKNPEKN